MSTRCISTEIMIDMTGIAQTHVYLTKASYSALPVFSAQRARYSYISLKVDAYHFYEHLRQLQYNRQHTIAIVRGLFVVLA